MSIGKRLLALRQQKGLSQQQLADYLHISRQTISKWESDLSLPDMKTAIQISEFYNISINELLGLEEETSEDSLKQLYEQTNVVLENIQKDNEKRKTRDFIFIIVGAICIVLLMCIYKEVSKPRENTVVIQNNTPTIQKDPEIFANYEIVKYHLDEESVDVNISLKLDSITTNAKAYVHLVDNDNQQYKYEMKQSGNLSFEYIGTVPFKDYKEVSVVVSDGEKDKRYDLLSVSMNLVDYFMNNYFDLTMYVDFDDEESLTDVTYGKSNYFDIDFDGQLDADVSIKIENRDHEVLLDETCKMFETKQMKLTRKMKMFEYVDTQCRIMYDGNEYNVYGAQQYLYNSTFAGLFEFIGYSR